LHPVPATGRASLSSEIESKDYIGKKYDFGAEDESVLFGDKPATQEFNSRDKCPACVPTGVSLFRRPRWLSTIRRMKLIEKTCLITLAVAVGITACVTKPSARKPLPPRDEIAEARKVVIESLNEVKVTLRALDEVTTHADDGLKKAVEEFGKTAHRLEVDSIKIRARAQAMRMRGDAYFEQWQQNIAKINSEQVRTRAEQHSEQLQEDFKQIHAAAQSAREGFKPFLADLRRLRAQLETDTSLASVDSAKTLILKTREDGHNVEQHIAEILAELNSVAATLKTAKSTRP
jgi:hypothetical protein